MATVKSFREFVFDSLEAFLYREGFPVNGELVKGIAFLANNICHYEEESIRLTPEILISTDLTSIAKTLPTHIVIRIGQGPITMDTFKKALKGTAPLGRDNWIIYVTVDSEANTIDYGLLASGMSEPNPSPYSHLRVGFTDLIPSVIYIKALSPRLLLVKGKSDELIISFSLEDYEYEDENYFAVLASYITSGVSEEWRAAANDLFVGVLEQAAESSHGCLIAVLREQDDALDRLRTQMKDGILLPEPLDMAACVIDSQQTHDSNAHMSLISMCAVLKRMIGYDGITILSSDGKLLGYNFFVTSDEGVEGLPSGGARTRAYQKLCTMDALGCVLFRSEDGAMRIHRGDANPNA